MAKITLREFLENKIDHERELREAHEAHIDLRLAGMNELRAQIDSERGSFVRSEVYDQKHEVTSVRMTNIEKSLGNLAASRATLNWVFGAIIAGAGLVVAVLTWMALKHP